MNVQAIQVLQLAIGLFIGVVLGYELNVEKTAQVMATKDCGVCQENLDIMVGNFNTVAKLCNQAKGYDVPLFPTIGLNQTVRIYGDVNAS